MQEQFYTGIDLHSTNSYIGIIDGHLNAVFEKRVKNDLRQIMSVLDPFKKAMQGIVVESTYNTYWLLDGLQENGYKVHLANPSEMDTYSGVKHQDDKFSSFRLAEALATGRLKEGYIYPKKDRPLRELLRRRMFFVHHRTSSKISLRSMIERYSGQRFNSSALVKLSKKCLETVLQDPALVMNARLTQLEIGILNKRVLELETRIKSDLKTNETFRYLQTIPGVGAILGMTITLETGDISRFASERHFCSYARCVPSVKSSNNRIKGSANRKNGNRYLSWAFAEASAIARRRNKQIQAYFNRKRAKTKVPIAYKAVSNKLAKAAYYIMRDKIPFHIDMFVR